MMKHMAGDEDNQEILNKVDGLLKNLREKEGELEDLEALNQTLIVKERKSNDELQDARKELVNVSACNIIFYLTFYFSYLSSLQTVSVVMSQNYLKIGG